MTPAIVLFLTYITGPGEPDITRHFDMPTIEECWSQAHDWVAHGVSQALKDKGIIGIQAGCAVVGEPEKGT